ncbi:hypothetical protein FGK63_04505 [Ruegeria sediminis]|uniref:HNH endonuclease n=1 Tax=Ruegeria sediminis TaxID=2583820 RepID=A0ABY2X5G7_9RHOB|nr:hypothetical protein [Ruegeria sediminis]TMV10328.1 hypothetical protein FGK63_04505 [Ruegeria sediminis]
MESLDKSRFIRIFDKFNDDLRAYNGSQFVSFTTGVPATWESYKPIIRSIALERLGADKWTTNDIGSGRILAAVIRAIEIKESQDVRNNLVPWEPRHNQPSETGRLRDELGNGPARQRFERHVFDLFRERREPADILDELVDLIGRRYSLIAYLYYVLDDSRFLPIGTTTFDKAFEQLGFDVRTTGRCSWSNYQEFIAAVHCVQAGLTKWVGVKDVRLIDAHSYLWLLVRLPQKIAQMRQQGLQRPGDLKTAMIGLAQGVINRVGNANGQLLERVVKNKELFGFSSTEAFYDFLCRAWEEQDGRCALTGLPMLLPQKRRPVTELVASIDRKDSAGHYSPDNIQLTCWFANRWKGTQADHDFGALIDILRRGEEAQRDYPQHFGAITE